MGACYFMAQDKGFTFFEEITPSLGKTLFSLMAPNSENYVEIGDKMINLLFKVAELTKISFTSCLSRTDCVWSFSYYSQQQAYQTM